MSLGKISVVRRLRCEGWLGEDEVRGSRGDGSMRTLLGRLRARDVLVFLGLVIVTVALATQLYGQYLANSRAQWALLHHDRNVHFLESILVAVDLSHLDFFTFVRDLHRWKTYPPLFRLLAAPVLAIGGFHYPLAALVSLGGWVGTVLVLFLLTRRLAPSHRNGVALVAALWLISSPPFRTYATDIMLESLGAFLTLVALSLYLWARDRPGAAERWTALACALTALFFLKYSYWFLTCAALLLCEGLSHYDRIILALRQYWTRGDLRACLSSAARRPLNWLLMGIAALAGLLLVAGKQEFFQHGYRVTTKASLDLIYLLYVLLWVQVAPRWWRQRRMIQVRVGEGAWRVICFHLLPVSVWLLWPSKLQRLLWYVSPFDSSELQRATYLNWDAIRSYPLAVLMEYHESLWVALVVIALALYALWRVAQLGRHVRVVLVFLAVSALLTILHPNQQNRFVHTWVPSLWIAAAIGFASLLGHFSRAGVIGRGISGGILALSLVAFGLKAGAFAVADPAASHQKRKPRTALDLSDYYLPRIGCYDQVSIFATVPLGAFATWTYLERYPTQRANLAVVMNKLGGSAESNSRRFAEWVTQTSAQAIVFVDVPIGSFFYFPGEDGHQRFRDAVRSQIVFQEAEQRTFPEYGATVSILVRNAGGKTQYPCSDDVSSDSEAMVR